MTDLEKLQAEVSALRTALQDVAALALAGAGFHEAPNEYRRAHLEARRDSERAAINAGNARGAAGLLEPETLKLLAESDGRG